VTLSRGTQSFPLIQEEIVKQCIWVFGKPHAMGHPKPTIQGGAMLRRDPVKMEPELPTTRWKVAKQRELGFRIPQANSESRPYRVGPGLNVGNRRL
jgi:hypothetical protein